MILSVISPAYNEEKYIGAAIDSFLQQQYDDFELEILIVDGSSTDRTREIVQQYAAAYPQVRLVDNPMRKTPNAFNEGLKAAKGEYVAILGAHSIYAPDYLQVCFNELKRTAAAGCSGRVVTKAISENTQSLLCEWVMDSAFAVSSLSFRIMKEGFVHSVNFPVFVKQVLLGIGGYNTLLERNQDNDLNQRILDAGHTLYCTWKTQCFYRPPANLKKLFKYAYRNGYWNAYSFKFHARSMRIHHIVPFLFTSGILMLVIIATGEYFYLHSLWIFQLLFILLGVYFTAAVAATIISFFGKPDVRKLMLPFVFFLFHFIYGWGTVRGLLKKDKSK